MEKEGYGENQGEKVSTESKNDDREIYKVQEQVWQALQDTN